jgi:carboxypeptidase C (cathepsin A)
MVKPERQSGGGMIRKIFCFGLLLFLIRGLMAEPILAQEGPAKPSLPTEKGRSQNASEGLSRGEPSVTRHSIKVKGQMIHYTATAGYISLRDEKGKVQAEMFFVAYVQDSQGDKSTRPATFAYNGGPGASSVWLHLAALGPKRVVLTKEGKAPPPPYRLAPNEYTWLEFTDLVFVDPVGTGYSRPAPGVKAKEFFGVEEDIHSMGEFIRLYATRYERWLSPKFVVGESYGTTRTAGLSGYLQNKIGMNLNGILLISSVLDFQTIVFTPLNNLPYILYLPCYTMAAGYHGKLSAESGADLRKAREEAERFAMNEYLLALAKGNQLSEAERGRLVEKLAAFTGLPKTYIKNSNLRVTRDHFVKELLHQEHLRVGVLDSRITGYSKVESFMEDPSVFEVTGPLVASWNDYVRRELQFESRLPYVFLSVKANRAWDWGSATGGMGFVNVARTLQQAMNENKFLKVFMASGYYDLDTSYFATRYTVNHLELGPGSRGNITQAFYEAGHQMYTDLPSLKKLSGDAAAFFRRAAVSP